MKNSLLSLVVILLIFFDFSCAPTDRMLKYCNSSISGIIDSVIVRQELEYKKHFFLVNNKWYLVRAGNYTEFIRYIDKGDSLYKESGRWDIYVYKKKNGKWVEKYFRGAQDDWD